MHRTEISERDDKNRQGQTMSSDFRQVITATLLFLAFAGYVAAQPPAQGRGPFFNILWITALTTMALLMRSRRFRQRSLR
jgi:hypothetical protein